MSNTLFGSGYEAKENVGGASKKLPAGGYVCRIMDAKIQNAQTSGLPMVVIQFDICEGEYNNFYHDKYKNDLGFRPSAKYQGIARIPAVDAEGKARRGFNSFCGAVEKSNDVKLPTEDTAFLNMLKNKFVGIIFGREEVQFDDGRIAMVTKPKFYRSTQAIESGDYKTPDDEYLQPSVSNTSNVATDVSSLFGVPIDSFSAAEDDIPFK